MVTPFKNEDCGPHVRNRLGTFLAATLEASGECAITWKLVDLRCLEDCDGWVHSAEMCMSGSDQGGCWSGS